MKQKTVSNYIISIVLIIAGLVFLYPLIWMFLLSFKASNEIYANPFGLPKEWLFNNYPEVLKLFDFPMYAMNSIIYSVGAVTTILICASLFSYACARMKWKLKDFFLNYIQLGFVIPGAITILSLYIMLRQLHLKDTYQGLIFVYAAGGLPLAVIIFYGFFRSLPFELEESAVIDGCNVFRAFYRIILPMVTPAVSTVVIISFMGVWNEYFTAFITIGEEKMRPLPIGLLNFMTGRSTEWGQLGAILLIVSIPTVLVYLIFSEKVEDALTSGVVVK